MKRFYTSLFFIVLLWLVACSKNGNSDFTVSQQQNLLVNAGAMSSSAKYTKWKLSALYINNVQQTLSANQLAYQKQYDDAGKYTDSDGILGTWSIPSKDSLVEVYTNYPSGTLSQGFKIISITTTEMTLNYKISTTDVTTVYKVAN